MAPARLAAELADLWRRAVKGIDKADIDDWSDEVRRIEAAIVASRPTSALDRLVRFAVSWNAGQSACRAALSNFDCDCDFYFTTWKRTTKSRAARLRRLETAAGVTLLDLGLDIYSVTAAEALASYRATQSIFATVETGTGVQ